MIYGLKCFNSLGLPILDTTKNTTYILGRHTTTKSAGSINDPALANGTPWYLVIGTSDESVQYMQQINYPNFSINGTTISWTSASVTCDFIYGWY